MFDGERSLIREIVREDDLPGLLNEMVRNGELVEIEYVLPDKER